MECGVIVHGGVPLLESDAIKSQFKLICNHYFRQKRKPHCWGLRH
jgi:hypothetical protein